MGEVTSSMSLLRPRLHSWQEEASEGKQGYVHSPMNGTSYALDHA